jgi:hypothetical protein
MEGVTIISNKNVSLQEENIRGVYRIQHSQDFTRRKYRFSTFNTYFWV